MDKKNFLLSTEHCEIIDSLNDEDCGKLFKGIYNYVLFNDSKLEGYLKTIFIPFRQFIEKNEETYQKICERNKENIKKRWEKEKIPSDTTVYESIPDDTDNNHIHLSSIINHNQKGKDRGMGEEKPIVTDDAGLLAEITKKVVEHLNAKTNASFRHTSKATQSKINARLNEGYKLDDFIAVIDKKFDEWKETEFEKYLCPETLFGTKFEKYLNQKANSNTSKKSETIKPLWLDKQVEMEPVSDKEKAELEEMLKEFK